LKLVARCEGVVVGVLRKIEAGGGGGEFRVGLG